MVIIAQLWPFETILYIRKRRIDQENGDIVGIYWDTNPGIWWLNPVCWYIAVGMVYLAIIGISIRIFNQAQRVCKRWVCCQMGISWYIMVYQHCFAHISMSLVNIIRVYLSQEIPCGAPRDI
jgi:hypothetical protein